MTDGWFGIPGCRLVGRKRVLPTRSPSASLRLVNGRTACGPRSTRVMGVRCSDSQDVSGVLARFQWFARATPPRGSKVTSAASQVLPRSLFKPSMARRRRSRAMVSPGRSASTVDRGNVRSSSSERITLNLATSNSPTSSPLPPK